MVQNASLDSPINGGGLVADKWTLTCYSGSVKSLNWLLLNHHLF